MALVKKTGTFTGAGESSYGIRTSLSTIKTLTVYHDTNDVQTQGLHILCYDETNGTFATFGTNIFLSRTTSGLSISKSGSISIATWNPSAAAARVGNNVKYTWIAYGEE